MTTHEVAITSTAGKTDVLAVHRGQAKAGSATRHYVECSCGWQRGTFLEDRLTAEVVAADHVLRQVSAEVDVVLDFVGSSPAVEMLKFALRARAQGVTATLLQEEGPGGGWPIFELAGDRSYVTAFLRELGYDPAEVIA